MQHDVIVVGGSYSGMAAALQLLRARRRVLVIDAGQRRNRFADHSYGFLGQDGTPPAEIAATARRQLDAYPTLTWSDGQAETASGQKDEFVVSQPDGEEHRGRRLLFATGVSDELPAIDGLRERWGISVFLCPYCHGYELDRGHIAVIATGPMSLHQAQLLPEWGTVTLLTNETVSLDETSRADLAARGVAIESAPIARIVDHADIVLRDGRTLRFAGIFTTSHSLPATPIAATLGCAIHDTPFGAQIKTDEAKQTTVSGAFACGDAARVPHSLSLAVADGAWAGANLHRSLVWPDA